MDRLLHRFKGKGKEIVKESTHLFGKPKPPVFTEVKRKAPDRLSRIHLVEDEYGYTYRLHPLIPATYTLSTEYEDSDFVVLLAPAGVEVELRKARILRSSKIPGSVGVEFDEPDISMQVFIQPNRLGAQWTMELPWSVVKQTESSSAKASSGKSAEAASEAADANNEFEDDPPPPYSEEVVDEASSSAMPPAFSPHKPYTMTSDEYGTNQKPEKYDKWEENITSITNTGQESFDRDVSNSEMISSDSHLSPNVIGQSKKFPWKDSGTTTHQVFSWEQVSSRARIKLFRIDPMTSPEPMVEFIQETDMKRIDQGVRGQLLFRTSFGHDWEIVVLLTIGIMVEIGKNKVWHE